MTLRASIHRNLMKMMWRASNIEKLEANLECGYFQSFIHQFKRCAFGALMLFSKKTSWKLVKRTYLPSKNMLACFKFFVCSRCQTFYVKFLYQKAVRLLCMLKLLHRIGDVVYELIARAVSEFSSSNYGPFNFRNEYPQISSSNVLQVASLAFEFSSFSIYIIKIVEHRRCKPKPVITISLTTNFCGSE